MADQQQLFSILCRMFCMQPLNNVVSQVYLSFSYHPYLANGDSLYGFPLYSADAYGINNSLNVSFLLLYFTDSVPV